MDTNAWSGSVAVTGVTGVTGADLSFKTVYGPSAGPETQGFELKNSTTCNLSGSYLRKKNSQT